MFDSHTHTDNSDDCMQDLDGLCSYAIRKGLSGICITDHVDIPSSKRTNAYQRIKSSHKAVDAARAKYGDKLTIFKGVELAEGFLDSDYTKSILALPDLDVVIGSLHRTLMEDVNTFYSLIDFSGFTSNFLNNYFRKYLSEVLYTAENSDIDILAHLTCPLRYINGKYGKGIDVNNHMDIIEKILFAIIKRNIALEINTSGLYSFYGEYMPPLNVVEMYYNLGGRLITLGSDAHIAQNVGKAFSETKEKLKAIGFSEYYYYKKRQPFCIKI